MGISWMISLNCDYHRDALIILSKTILIRHLGTISDPYTPLDHPIYILVISLHLKIDCVSVCGHFVYDSSKLRLLQGCVDYNVKNDLDSSSRHHFWPIYTFRSSNLLIDHFIASKNRLFSVYGHFVNDITKLRLLQGCADCTVKNDLDSSFRHHFWPIYTIRSSNIFIDHFIASKNRLRYVYGHFVYDITKLRLLQGCVDYTVKNDLDSSSRHNLWPTYTLRSSNLFIDHSLHLKIDWLASMGL